MEMMRVWLRYTGDLAYSDKPTLVYIRVDLPGKVGKSVV
jgi:hypothetical protein